MELIAKINNDDNINLQFVKEDRDYFYIRLRDEFSAKVIEKLESEIKSIAGREIAICMESIVKKSMDSMTSNIYEVISKNICLKLDAIIEQEKMRIKHVPFTIEYKIKTGNAGFSEREAEDYLKEMYIKSGYSCYRSKDFCNEMKHKVYLKALKDKFGIPDLIVWNDTQAFFVEVKLFNGSIQGNQLSWYANHPDVNSIICFVGTESDLRTKS